MLQRCWRSRRRTGEGFATSISDRGEAFSSQFDQRYGERLAAQAVGEGAFHALVADDGSILGRFNLAFVQPGVAELGCRVAAHVAGRGVATASRPRRQAGHLVGTRPRRARVTSRDDPSPRVVSGLGRSRPGVAAEAYAAGAEPGSAINEFRKAWKVAQ
ncbi:GNAT family N-acetyltransferase [Salsipaludibacter albus]|uniref:GNAT family N-acetyltransferase n=1 Tax=Salsipaludibacter albus TaxID=2849650 RepID=UPI001EE3FD62|nr:GNAT family N-acetyltransferase [Salsipaludibacter albus]MBY5161909.1 GNAT family N-acetyltransferase [Salsipaludibacter albus]